MPLKIAEIKQIKSGKGRELAETRKHTMEGRRMKKMTGKKEYQSNSVGSGGGRCVT